MLMLLPVSFSYNGQTISAEVPLRLRGIPMDPMEEWDKEYEKLQRELADMRAELERAKIRSGLAERKLYPHDMALVERLILEQGGSIEDAIANIYGTRPYLFKVTTVAPSKSSTSSSADDKAANERFLNAVVARICRDNVSLK